LSAVVASVVARRPSAHLSIASAALDCAAASTSANPVTAVAASPSASTVTRQDRGCSDMTSQNASAAAPD
jgi:hypothetical protein